MFQWFYLSDHGHMRETHCFPFEQHSYLLRAWLLEGFILMVWKKKMIMCSLPTKRATCISLTKTLFQRNCKLYNISESIPLLCTLCRHGIWLWRSFRSRNIFMQRNVVENLQLDFCVSLKEKFYCPFLATPFFWLILEVSSCSIHQWHKTKKST